MMKYNEKVERFAPKLGRKNLANGLSCPPFVYMDDSDDGMWVHYAKYCENIAKQKYKRCLAMAKQCGSSAQIAWDHAFSCDNNQYAKIALFCEKWRNRWLELAEKFKEAK
jgi:hypothetical protein